MPVYTVPFFLTPDKETDIERGRVLSRVFQVRGVARLEADRLTLEWSGTMQIVDIQGGNVRNLRQSVPAQRLLLPVSRVANIEMRGRWWRPYIELRTSGIGPLERMPTASGGRVYLRLTRRDWSAARELVSHLQFEMAEAALREIENGDARDPQRDPESARSL